MKFKWSWGGQKIIKNHSNFAGVLVWLFRTFLTLGLKKIIFFDFSIHLNAYMVKRKPELQKRVGSGLQRKSGKRRKCAGQNRKTNTVAVCSNCGRPNCGVCCNGDWKLTKCKDCRS